MESKPVRMVNVVPITKLKKVPLPDDNEDTVACRICNKSFAHEIALKNHSRIEHIDALLSGQDICVRKTKAIKTVPKNDEIDKCEKKAKKPRIDKGKMKVSDKKIKEVMVISGPFECLHPSALVTDSLCRQMFFSCCEYSAHIRDEHTRRRKGVKCQVCEKPLASTGTELPYVCQFCDTGFERCMDLSDHVTKHHTKIKPFHCTICNKRFTQQGGLAQHMRAHSGDKPFTCTYCPKAFTQKSGLDQHLRIHTKCKPYKCVICKKTFCQSVHLQQHMRTHTNVAPFQCVICDKRFKQSSHLNYHLKYHDPMTLTDVQKEKYAELMRIMGKESIFDILDDPDRVDGVKSEVEQCDEVFVDGQELLEHDLGNAVEVIYLDPM